MKKKKLINSADVILNKLKKEKFGFSTLSSAKYNVIIYFVVSVIMNEEIDFHRAYNFNANRFLYV